MPKRINHAWTAISLDCYNSLCEVADEKKTPMTKVVLNILYNNMPDKLMEDYSFNTADAKEMVIKLSDEEFEYITKLAAEKDIKISRLIRNTIYTFLKQEKYLK